MSDMSEISDAILSLEIAITALRARWDEYRFESPPDKAKLQGIKEAYELLRNACAHVAQTGMFLNLDDRHDLHEAQMQQEREMIRRIKALKDDSD